MWLLLLHGNVFSPKKCCDHIMCPLLNWCECFSIETGLLMCCILQYGSEYRCCGNYYCLLLEHPSSKKES